MLSLCKFSWFQFEGSKELGNQRLWLSHHDASPAAEWGVAGCAEGKSLAGTAAATCQPSEE